jgi:hypothetical protein
MQLNKQLLILLIALSNSLFAGFSINTLVKSSDSFSAIQDLSVGDLVEGRVY